MTLLVNEIHIQGDLKKGFIICAADRRITLRGQFHSNRHKLFRIPYLNACVGYFGLAQINHRDFLSSWLPNFIKHSCESRSLREFSERLIETLNRCADTSLLNSNPSGFHICGYNADNYPELWFVRNIEGMEGFAYKGFLPKYLITEDFLARDARRYGFDGVHSQISSNFLQYYINGDTRPFHTIWLRLDKFLVEMFSQADFVSPTRPSDLEKIVKWKFQVISTFYKQFAKRKTIGTPVDAFVLLPGENKT